MSKMAIFSIKSISASMKMLKQIAIQYPVEVLMALFSFIYAYLGYKGVITHNSSYAALVPLFFVLSFVCNSLLSTNSRRWIYYLSFIPFIACYFIPSVNSWIYSTSYFISIIISVLVLISYNLVTDNEAFISQSFGTAFRLGKSLLISGISGVVVTIIYSSILYIFDFGKDSDFIVFIYLFFFVFCWPVLFLALEKEKDYFDLKSSGLFNILLNYLFSPALIIYTLVLYAYIVQRIALGSLPKGNVAYMVFSFVIVGLIARSFQPFLKKKLYDWFYNNFRIIVIPVIGLFWVGVAYRIWQYGFTMDRVYLFACGLIMTLAILFLYINKTDRYLYISLLSIGLLGIITFIPGITASNLGLYSQEHRFMKAVKELPLIYKNHIIMKSDSEKTITPKDIESYKVLKESFKYILTNRGETVTKDLYGYNSIDSFVASLIPADVEKQIDTKSFPYSYITLTNPAERYNIEGYTQMMRQEKVRDSLIVMRKDSSVIFSCTLNYLLEQQLKKENMTAKDLDINLLEHKESFYILKEDSCLVIIENYNLNRPSSEWDLSTLDAMILIK